MPKRVDPGMDPMEAAFTYASIDRIPEKPRFLDLAPGHHPVLMPRNLSQHPVHTRPSPGGVCIYPT
jgi:hypothetical protein